MTGAASGSTHRAASQYDSGGFPVAALDRTNVYVSYGDDGTPTLQGKADLTSFDADGFTLTYTSPDATAREVIYLAMGNAAAGGGRTTKNTRSNPLGVEIGMNWQGNL
jgi:hypothetical protein